MDVKYTAVYRGENAPRRTDVLWVHHSVKNDLTSPIVVQSFSKGRWVDAYDKEDQSDITRLTEQLGDVTTLETTAQDSVVDAINEVVGNTGDLDDLTTTEKTTLVGAINEAATSGDPASLLYTAQTLTDAQKAQARANMGAASEAELQALNSGEVVPVASLPTASADTMGKVYLVGPDANSEYDRYVSSYDGTDYTWVQIGTTEMDLSGYATDEELDELAIKVDGKKTLSSSDFTIGQGLILFTSDSTFKTGTSYPGRYGLLAVDSEKKIKVDANSTGRTMLAFLSSNNLVLNQAPPFVSGTTKIIIDTNESSGILNIPDGTAYIYIYASTADTGDLNRWPSSIVEWFAPGIKQEIEEVDVELGRTNTELEKTRSESGLFDLSWILNNALNPDGTLASGSLGFDASQIIDIPENINTIVYTRVSMSGTGTTDYSTIVLYAADGETVVYEERALRETITKYHITSVQIPDTAKKVRFARYHTPDGRGVFFANFGPVGRVFKDLDDRITDLIPEVKTEITLENTDIIFTARNFIVKEVDIEGTKYIKTSNDLGNTWHQVENTFGTDIMFVHFFRNGSMLLCTPSKAYYSDDYETFTEAAVYDYDGSVFSADLNFFYSFADSSDNYTIEGKEAFAWSDYNRSGLGFVSRVWFTDDNGHTIRCILRNGAIMEGGEELSVLHFHDCRWDKWENCLWISSGDTTTQCNLIKGTVSNGVWSFSIIQSGEDWKFGQIIPTEEYLYLITDFTGGLSTGIVVIDKKSPTSYMYLYKHTSNRAMSGLFFDDFGWRILFYDGAIYNKILVAKGDMLFSDVIVNLLTDNSPQTLAVTHPIGPNYNGDLLVTGGNYVSACKLNRDARYMLTGVLRDSGYENIGKINPFNK